MSFQERRQAAQEQNEARLQEAASLLHGEFQSIYDELDAQQALQRKENVTFYTENEDGSMKEAIGHEDSCKIQVRDRVLEFADRTYDDPATGTAEHVYFIGGEELLIERSPRGAEGPFGILLFTDQANEVVAWVQAKYYQNESSVSMPAELLRDTALVLHQERTARGIVPGT